jgi:hypothetical protein
VNFGPFSTPVLNHVGQVAFFANLTGTGVTGSNNEGVWRGGPGSLSLVARRGDQAPGTATGVNFGSPSIPVLNDAGQFRRPAVHEARDALDLAQVDSDDVVRAHAILLW